MEPAKVVLANSDFLVKEVTPRNAAKIACLLYPHLKQIAVTMLAADQNASINSLFMALSQIPGAEMVIIEIYCALIDIDVHWFLENVSTLEMAKSLPVINEVNSGVIGFIYEVVLGLLPLRNG